jgi:hypothetical protein
MVPRVAATLRPVVVRLLADTGLRVVGTLRRVVARRREDSARRVDRRREGSVRQGVVTARRLRASVLLQLLLGWILLAPWAETSTRRCR